MAHDLILMEFYPHYIHESKTKGYNPISTNVFHFTLMRFHFKKTYPVRHILPSLSFICYKIYTESMLRDGLSDGIRVGGHLIKECVWQLKLTVRLKVYTL